MVPVRLLGNRGSSSTPSFNHRRSSIHTRIDRDPHTQPASFLWFALPRTLSLMNFQAAQKREKAPTTRVRKKKDKQT